MGNRGVKCIQVAGFVNTAKNSSKIYWQDDWLVASQEGIITQIICDERNTGVIIKDKNASIYISDIRTYKTATERSAL